MRVNPIIIVSSLVLLGGLQACGKHGDTAQTEEAARIERDAQSAPPEAQDRGQRIDTAQRDADISARVSAALGLEDPFKTKPVDVGTLEGRVVLMGKVPDEAARERAGQLARGISGVQGVDNRLVVDPKR